MIGISERGCGARGGWVVGSYPAESASLGWVFRHAQTPEVRTSMFSQSRSTPTRSSSISIVAREVLESTLFCVSPPAIAPPTLQRPLFSSVPPFQLISVASDGRSVSLTSRRILVQFSLFQWLTAGLSSVGTKVPVPGVGAGRRRPLKLALRRCIVRAVSATPRIRVWAAMFSYSIRRPVVFQSSSAEAQSASSAATRASLRIPGGLLFSIL